MNNESLKAFHKEWLENSNRAVEIAKIKAELLGLGYGEKETTFGHVNFHKDYCDVVIHCRVYDYSDMIPVPYSDMLESNTFLRAKYKKRRAEQLAYFESLKNKK